MTQRMPQAQCYARDEAVYSALRSIAINENNLSEGAQGKIGPLHGTRVNLGSSDPLILPSRRRRDTLHRRNIQHGSHG